MAFILDGASEADLKRMATLWLYSDMTGTSWKAAHTAYDPDKKTQLASFKTVSNRSLAKYKKAAKEGTSGKSAARSQADGEQAEKPTKPTVKKCKSAAEVRSENGEGEVAPVKKPKATPKPRAKKGSKKSAGEQVTAGEDGEAVKDEAEDDA